MVKVKALRAHGNQYGDDYHKSAGDIYTHPAPDADISFGYVEIVDESEATVEAEEKPAKAEKKA